MARRRKGSLPESHSAAVERMLTSTGLVDFEDEAPLVMLLVSLAKQMDEDPSSTRTQQAYLSALKDARRVLNAAAQPSTGKGTGARKTQEPEPPVEPDEPDEVTPPAPDNLLLFEQKHGIN